MLLRVSLGRGFTQKGRGRNLRVRLRVSQLDQNLEFAVWENNSDDWLGTAENWADGSDLESTTGSQ